MCRHSISIRLSSGAYGIKYLIINPFFFHRAIYSSNSSLLCMEELSITTTVFLLIFLQKSFKQATTTEVLRDWSKRYGYNSFFLFISPFAQSIFNFLNFKLSVEGSTQPQPLQDVLLQF